MSARILIAGAGGQVGQAIVALGKPGTMIGLGRRELDLADPASIDAAVALHRPDAIINAAAYTAVDAAEDDEAAAFATNASGAAHLAKAAAQWGAALIHLSTDYVFDGTAERPYREEDQTAPINAYGRTKLAGEKMVSESHPSACIVRTSWVYASQGRNFVRTMLALAGTRETINVVSDQTGSPTFADDLAAALLQLVPQLLTGGGPRVLHLTGSGTTSWFGFAEAIFARLRESGARVAALNPVATTAWSARARRPAYSSLDCGLASATYGLAMPDWRDGLRCCLDSLLDPQRLS